MSKHHWLYTILACVVLYAAYYTSGYFFVYNNDAYVNSDWVNVPSQLDGKIVKVLVKNHQKVTVGQPLVQLDATNYSLALKQAQSALAATNSTIDIDNSNIHSANIKLTQDKFQLNLDQKDLMRDVALEAKHLIAKQSVDAEQTKTKIARLQVASDKVALSKTKQQLLLDQKNVQKLQATVAKDQWQLNNTTIRASVSGYVSNLDLQPGDYVQQADNLFSIVKDNWWITADIKESNLIKIQPGQTAWVYLTSKPGHLYKAHVVSIDRGVARSQNETRGGLPYVAPATSLIRYEYRVPVKLQLDEHIPGLIKGLSAKVFVFPA
ncbi:HlyD family secretion protein [Vibrio sp. S4M6]|uniref:HlyD family secretion protein n=1 Tax=Vibrio sinus TaxID=2946865 RepID=UPI002029CEAF|nr:HlyD family secretion protein [Vibrio sinus]MCL9780228.1 HlyD family secretion protein [Vibrio sinus]